jgi:hypothetical protein
MRYATEQHQRRDAKNTREAAQPLGQVKYIDEYFLEIVALFHHG